MCRECLLSGQDDVLVCTRGQGREGRRIREGDVGRSRGRRVVAITIAALVFAVVVAVCTS